MLGEEVTCGVMCVHDFYERVMCGDANLVTYLGSKHESCGWGLLWLVKLPYL